MLFLEEDQLFQYLQKEFSFLGFFGADLNYFIACLQFDNSTSLRKEKNLLFRMPVFS